MAAKKKGDKGAKKGKKGKDDNKEGEEIKKVSPGELPAVQWTCLCWTIILVIVAIATSFLCVLQWRKTLPIRSAFETMKKAVIEEYDELFGSSLNVILNTIKNETKNVIATENRISRVEFKIKEVIALFRSDWVQGVGSLFYVSDYEYNRQQCVSNCEGLNASVVVIKDMDKEYFLEKYLQNRRGCYWIGVVLAPNNIWYYTDGTAVNVGFWGTNYEKNAQCVCLKLPCYDEYRCWAKHICSALRRCLCEKGPDSLLNL